MKATGHRPAVVVAAWNRPRSLQRLLSSMAVAKVPSGTTLHISIDAFQYPDVVELARQFPWPFGEKVVEVHPVRLGLQRHILHCGGLSQRYGSVVLLEDDLVVSPEFYAYTVAALDGFAADPNIAGQSLYAYEIAESSLRPFRPWMDGSDNWFLQMPSSWGAAFTAAQWEGFSNWLDLNSIELEALPQYVQAWSSQSWKRLHVAYLLATGRYWAYPRVSLATNFEDAGVHANTRGLFQVPLLMGPKTWHFRQWAESAAVYDAHFEPLPQQLKAICPALRQYEFDVDLQGAKASEFLQQPYFLTTRRGGKVVLQFDDAALPLEVNLGLGIAGDGIRLVKNGTQLLPPNPLESEFSTLYGAERSVAMRLPLHRLPAISIILSLDGATDAATLASILGQDFPGVEVIALVSSGRIAPHVWQAFQAGKLRMVEANAGMGSGISKAVAAASGQWIWMVDQPCSLRQGTARLLSNMFREMQDLHWVTGLPVDAEPLISKRIALYRWDSARFSDADSDELRAYLPAALQIFRKDLWFDAGEPDQGLYEHFRNMGRISLPQVAGLDLVEGLQKPQIPSHWGTGTVNASRKYYHRHVPILWKHHLRLSDYPPVLRWDEIHHTWFEWHY